MYKQGFASFPRSRNESQCLHGSYDGCWSLYLTDAGDFAPFGYSRYATGWHVCFVLRDAAWVAQHYDVEPIIQTLANALDRAQGSRAKAVVAARARTAKLRALATLLTR